MLISSPMYKQHCELPAEAHHPARLISVCGKTMRVHDILLLLSALAGCLVVDAVSDPRARLLPTNHGKRRGGAYFQRSNAAVDQGLTRALRSRGGEMVRPGTAAASAIAHLDSGKRIETRRSPKSEAKEPRGAKGWGQLRRSPGSQSSSELVPRGGGQAASSATAGVSKQAYKAALLKTCLLVACAGAFGLGTWVIKGKKSGLEFFAGYIVEQSLSVDNLFIFIMLFDYFKVPAEFQSRVLNWGIIGAMSMRAVMIVVGVAAIQRFRWVMLFFAGILVVSSANLLLEKEDDHDSAQLENNTVLKIAKWMCDSTDYYDGEKFFTVVDGAKKATPLLLCLICIELTDFVFAVDSIPAVLGISHDTFIVYASNVFAICAMRSIYTLVSHAISDLPFLKPAVALVLGFVGAKMFAEFFHYEISVGVSLLVVSFILSVGAIASIVSNRRRDAAAADSAAPSAVSGGWASAGLTFEPPSSPAADGEGDAAFTAAGVSQESAATAAAVVGTVDAALPDIESEGREQQRNVQGVFDSASADPKGGDAEEAALPPAEGSAPGEGFSGEGGVVESDGGGGAGTDSAEAAGAGVAGGSSSSTDEGAVREDGGEAEALGEASGESAASVAGDAATAAAAAADAAAAAAAAAGEKLDGLVGAEHEGEKAAESAAVGGEEGEEGRQGGGS